MSEDITVYKRAYIKSDQRAATEEEVERARAVAAGESVATSKRVATDGGRSGSDPYDRHGVSAAIAGSSPEDSSSGQAAVAKSESTRKAAVALVKKEHDRKERSKVIDTNNPFDERQYSEEIRETSGALRRLKVLRGNATPQNAPERHLASLEGDRHERAVATQKQMLPDVDLNIGGISAAIGKSNGTERPDQGDQDGSHVYDGSPSTFQRTGDPFVRGDDR